MAIEHVWIDPTTGKEIARGKFGGDRWYRETVTGNLAVGVSSVVDMLPKPALTPWAARMAAIYAVDNIDAVKAIARDDRDAAIDLIKGAPWRKSGRAADSGTEVHTYTEMVMRAKLAGERPTGKVPAVIMPYLKQYVRFMDEMQVEPVMLETVVWNEDPEYAGRLDLICRMKDHKGLVIVDTKSGASGVWESAALQQTAYRYATLVYDETAEEFRPMPEIEATYGLWLRPEGWALQPLDSTEEEWEQIKRLHGSYLWRMRRSKVVVRPAINEVPLKRKWRGRNAA